MPLSIESRPDIYMSQDDRASRAGGNSDLAEFSRRFGGADSLRNISDERLKSFVLRVAQTPANIKTADWLRKQYEILDSKQAQFQLEDPSKAYPQDQLDLILVPLAKWVEERDMEIDRRESTSTTLTRNIEPTTDFQQQQLDIQRQQLEEQRRLRSTTERLQQEGKHGFVKDLLNQSKNVVSPSSQPWFSTIENQERGQILAQHRILVALEGKKGGPKAIDIYNDNFHLSREELRELWKSDGYRMTMAELFDSNDGLFSIGNLNPADHTRGLESGATIVRGLVLTEKGRTMLQQIDLDNRENRFSEYRDGLIAKIKAYYQDHPGRIPFGLLSSYDSSSGALNNAAQNAAEASFAMAWNVISVSAVPESADATRKVVNSDKRVMLGGWRTAFHPHGQAASKWVRSEVDKMGTEEDLFGISGRWVQERCRHDDTFRDNFGKYREGYRFYLRVTLGSMFDHAYFKDSTPYGDSLGEVLVNTPKRVVNTSAGEMRDFAQDVNFMGLRDADPCSYYTDLLDSVTKVNTLMTVSDPKEIKYPEFVGGLLSLQDKGRKGDPLLASIYDARNLEDMIVMALVVASGGPKEYSPAIRGSLYSYELWNWNDTQTIDLLKDDRIFKILGEDLGTSGARSMRERVVKRTNAIDTSTMRGINELADAKVRRGWKGKIWKATYEEEGRKKGVR